ncbi:hypothetical protein K0B04_00805 [Patescibacteria group bacterium]|nr:hypothetical protein [Patescibacteria group bacterium]
MYYILAATFALLIFVLFIKALGAVLRGILTTVFLIIIVVSVIIMFKSLNEPVELFGLYRVENFEITKHFE